MTHELNIDAAKIYTSREVADLFHVDIVTVYGWMRRKLITPLPTIGSSKRFRGSELLTALAMNGYGTPQPVAATTGEQDLAELLAMR